MKILAVDDDGIALNLMQECLAQGGYEYMTFMSSPVDVVRTLENTAIPYDCILLDVEMPKINGIKLCGEIRQLARYRNTPILMITKRNDHASVERAFANGATDYITKPFEFFEVLTRIKVAERLVQERQAAIDSYLAVQTRRDRNTDNVARSWKGADAHPDGVVRESLMPLSTLHNYLDRAAQDVDSEIDLIAVKFCQISDIFEKTTAAEFLHFLEFVARSVTEVFGSPNKAFVSHAGNGTFFYASQYVKEFIPSVKEQELTKLLSSHKLPMISRSDLEHQVVIGEPLSLNRKSKLNFRRAVKAATARMEKREGLSRSKIPMRSHA